MNINNFGILYIVATPLGNMQDITFRAIEILKKVDFIAAEDTRHSSTLLQHYAISTPVFSFHEHNEREETAELLDKLRNGKSIALISDAGTPLISDPGFFLVREAREFGIRVVPIPGPSALITALSASGLPTDRFMFEGFLPPKTKGRTDRLQAVLHEPRTIIYYEAPHRILDLLEDMAKVFGPSRYVVLARELTKVYETILSGPLNDVIQRVRSDMNQQKGEMVVLVAGADKPVLSTPSHEIVKLLLENLPLKQAVDVAAKITGKRKNDLYEIALNIKKDQK